MDFALRDFREGDFERLWEIDQQCFATGIAYSRRELRTYISAPAVFTLVAETVDENSGALFVLGFIVAQANRRRVGHVITIDVVEAGRRKGFGSRLLKSAEQRFGILNCVRVRLETAVDNSSAIEFYKRHGYQVTKTIAGYYPNGVDALSLEKAL